MLLWSPLLNAPHVGEIVFFTDNVGIVGHILLFKNWGKYGWILPGCLDLSNIYRFYFLFKLSFRLIYLIRMIFCLQVCMCSMCIPGTTEVKRRLQTPCSWSYSWLWIIMQMLRLKPRSSARAGNAPNHWSISLAPLFYFCRPNIIWRMRKRTKIFIFVRLPLENSLSHRRFSKDNW